MPREQSWVADSGIHEWIANNKDMKTRTNHCLNMNALHNPSLTALPMPMNTPACEVWKAESRCRHRRRQQLLTDALPC